jgi:hypothetical protein
MVAKKAPVKKTVATKTVVKKTVAKKPPVKKPVEKKTVAAKKPPVKKPVAEKPKLTVKAKSEKDLATKRGEPYVKILNVELDTDNIGNGAFELDWNDVFVAKLVRAGYQGNTDADIVDNWFKTICRNILTEEYEQWEANQPESQRPRVIDRRDLGDGKSEIS